MEDSHQRIQGFIFHTHNLQHAYLFSPANDETYYAPIKSFPRSTTKHGDLLLSSFSFIPRSKIYGLPLATEIHYNKKSSEELKIPGIIINQKNKLCMRVYHPTRKIAKIFPIDSIPEGLSPWDRVTFTAHRPNPSSPMRIKNITPLAYTDHGPISLPPAIFHPTSHNANTVLAGHPDLKGHTSNYWSQETLPFSHQNLTNIVNKNDNSPITILPPIQDSQKKLKIIENFMKTQKSPDINITIPVDTYASPDNLDFISPHLYKTLISLTHLSKIIFHTCLESPHTYQPITDKIISLTPNRWITLTFSHSHPPPSHPQLGT